MEKFWNDLGNKTEDNVDERLWELYHENSKLTKYNKSLSQSELHQKTLDLIISQHFNEYTDFELASNFSKKEVDFWELIKNRVTARDIMPVPISFTDLSAMLFGGYGVTRSNDETDFPHPFRTVPSAGGLYPIEIYFHHNYVEGLESGLYHYNPMKNVITQLRKGDYTTQIRELFIQPELVVNSSIVIFITMMIERSAFKYGERAYRFAHLEAGHISQNINLIAQYLGYSTLNIGGFLDNQTDEFLKLDGVNNSCIYCLFVGKDKI